MHIQQMDLVPSHANSPNTNVGEHRPVNVSQVKKLSPFRYPGGKTWCVPSITSWISGLPRKKVFVEPFAGGAIASLTVAIEGLVDRVIMAEIDADVAAVWTLVLKGEDNDFRWLCRRILDFELEEKNVRQVLLKPTPKLREQAFRTILKNRVNRGGILAPGASLIKGGENGRGLLSRWYPDTLVNRLKTIRSIRRRISFFHDDAFKVITRYEKNEEACFFVDPPYTAGGKRAGARLYAHNEIDHARLFHAMSKVRGDFLMTYDDAAEVRELATASGFLIDRVPMKSAHHAVHHELLIKRV